MANYASHLSVRATPQTEPDPSRGDQVVNSAGGFVFAVDDWQRLDRFLVLGTEGGTYYATEKKLTIENARCIERCLQADAARTVARIVEISDSGRIPKNDTAIFALAVCCARRALEVVSTSGALIRVCRTGSHLLQFVRAVRELRGGAPALQRLVASWYEGQAVDRVAFQVAKYRQRDGMSHRDVVRLCHPAGATPAHAALYRWIVKGREGLAARTVDRTKSGRGIKEYPAVDPALLPAIVDLYDRSKAASTKAEVLACIAEGAPREFFEGSHSEHFNDRDVWAALLERMPLTAMIRNLGKMTAVGLIGPLSEASKVVCDRLADVEYLRRSRVHPLAVLVAHKVYAQGRGMKGQLSWSPDRSIVDATDAAFYAAFGNVAPTGKRVLLALDVSGSMGAGSCGGMPLCPAEAAAAMALVTANSESRYHVVGYSTTLRDLPISPRMRLADVLSITRNMAFGGTDCALPFTEGLARGLEFDACVSYTDNETWAGPVHVHQAVRQYRNRTGILAKLVACAFTATGFSIADPDDAGMLDVVGLDLATPGVISDFIRGGAASVATGEAGDRDGD